MRPQARKFWGEDLIRAVSDIFYQVVQSFYRVFWVTRLGRKYENLRGERARSDCWIYERTISNTLSNLILDSTRTTLTYKTARIRSPAQHIYIPSFLRSNRVKISIFVNQSNINKPEFDLARIRLKYFTVRKLFREFTVIAI